MMSELDKQCPRCKSANPEFHSGPFASRASTATAPRTTAVAAVSRGAAVSAVAPPPSPPKGMDGIGPVYTQCAWQRPDGRWLNSKEIAEMEQLAHKYVTIRPSGKTGGLDRIISMIGIGKGKEEAVEKIKNRVTEIGIPFGIFQAYANSLRD
jgi:hypothetical protein